MSDKETSFNVISENIFDRVRPVNEYQTEALGMEGVNDEEIEEYEGHSQDKQGF